MDVVGSTALSRQLDPEVSSPPSSTVHCRDSPPSSTITRAGDGLSVDSLLGVFGARLQAGEDGLDPVREAQQIGAEVRAASHVMVTSMSVSGLTPAPRYLVGIHDEHHPWHCLPEYRRPRASRSSPVGGVRHQP